jgi:hypothetical protein
LNAIVPVANISKQEFIDILNKSMGLINLALEKSGLDKKTYHSWINEDMDFAREVGESTENASDKVEGMLFKKIQQGNIQAIMFYCETKLRNRGYYKKS